ncbi:uncharacterized protein ARMOST_18112 [Armillaria ostoyae]|uniref:Uncharacterized protein n=1 Tax=Armillaria ostoyae TaxID=47428 RepID=A0A284S0Y6_ARMOS|nr:uncharacterized protein ARMOST_18112 [Armillaria ostoyae]
METARRWVMGEVGGNAQSYPHDSLVRAGHVEGRATEGRFAHSVHSKNISSPSKHKHGVVLDAARGLRIRVWMVAWSANIPPRYLATSDKRAQNHGYANRVTRAAVHPHPIQNEAFPCRTTRLSI